MAKKKRCKECEGQGKECKCNPKRGRLGYYGLDRDHEDDEMHADGPMGGVEGGDGGGAMGEAVKMPRAPQDSDKGMQGMSQEKKKRKLDDFRAAASDAKKRQADADRKDELAVERMRKGIRFYDSKGSGYMKGGKKSYD